MASHMATTPLEVHCNLHYLLRILSQRENNSFIRMSQLPNIKSFWDERPRAGKKTTTLILMKKVL